MKTQVELRHEIKTARDRGWTVQATNGDHVEFLPPAGLLGPDRQPAPVIRCGSTPSDYRVIRIVRGRLARYGAIDRKGASR